MTTTLSVSREPSIYCDEKEKARILSMLRFERSLWENGTLSVAGIDEAGRGPLAGPVVAAAVLFQPDVFIPRINDSKKLTPERREALFLIIQEKAQAFGIGLVSEKEIDQINILQATFRAMLQALCRLPDRPDHLLVDGFPIPGSPIPQTAIIKGDQKCFSIAAASIIAKVTRDRMMAEYDRFYPEYGFARHKGYATRVHIEAIRKFGYCEIHRRSFGVKVLERL